MSWNARFCKRIRSILSENPQGLPIADIYPLVDPVVPKWCETKFALCISKCGFPPVERCEWEHGIQGAVDSLSDDGTIYGTPIPGQNRYVWRIKGTGAAGRSL